MIPGILNIPLDRIGGFVVTADVLHSVGHEGYLHDVSFRVLDGSFDIAAPQSLVITTGAKWVHMTWEAEAFGIVTLTRYKTPTIGAGGSTLTPYNKKSGEGNRLLSTFKLNPAINAVGTQDRSPRTMFGTTTGSSKASSSIRSGAEELLEPNTVYLYQAVAAADNTVFRFYTELYERTHIV